VQAWVIFSSESSLLSMCDHPHFGAILTIDFLTIVAEPCKALRVTDGISPVSSEIYVRMCSLLKFVQDNSFKTPSRAESLKLNEQEHSIVKTAVENRWDMLHSELHSAAFILNPRYHATHDFSGDAMLEHDKLLHLWMDEGQLHKYKLGAVQDVQG
jgi:hypothetical protein